MVEQGHVGRVRLVGGIAGLAVAALVLTLMLVIGQGASGNVVEIAQLLAITSVGHPALLGPLICGGALLVAALAGARLATSAEDAPLEAAIGGISIVVGACLAWTFVASVIALGIEGGLPAALVIPIEATIFVFGGLLPPAIVLFLPAALLWAAVVRSTRGMA